MTEKVLLILFLSYLVGATPSAYLVSQFVGKKEMGQYSDGDPLSWITLWCLQGF